MLLNYLPVLLLAIFILYEVKCSGNKYAFYFLLFVYLFIFIIIVPSLELSSIKSFTLENVIGRKEILNNQIWYLIFFGIPIFLQIRKNVVKSLPDIAKESKHNVIFNLTFYHVIFVGMLSYISYNIFHNVIYFFIVKILNSNMIAGLLSFLSMQSFFLIANKFTPYIEKKIEVYIPQKIVSANNIQGIKNEGIYRNLTLINLINPIITAILYFTILFLIYLCISISSLLIK